MTVIDPGDRVEYQGKEWLVTDSGQGALYLASGDLFGAFSHAPVSEVRLVAKARYEQVEPEPAEDEEPMPEWERELLAAYPAKGQRVSITGFGAGEYEITDVDESYGQRTYTVRPVTPPEPAEDPVVADLLNFLVSLEPTVGLPVSEHYTVKTLIEDRNRKAVDFDLAVREADEAYKRGCADALAHNYEADRAAQVAAWRYATGCDTPEEAQRLVKMMESGYAYVEVVRWREATGCDTPEEAERLLGRLRGELDEAREELQDEKDSYPKGMRRDELILRGFKSRESEVARLTARAERAELALADLGNELYALSDKCFTGDESGLSDETGAGE